ncbi:transcriptional regulator [Actinomadura craniellae]|uniref:Transcriptional regulator n=1 Tax=Actinomadura craniellae TaxID=2231787 RepID=A0A365GXL6_9ACTN|nr:helix-turn-helix domain-containing protein [Actinomadura craniellae]RAY11584.1 transcriptional regulator [Actinomadura craniellae]
MATTSAMQGCRHPECDANVIGGPGHEVLVMLSDKWVTLIVSALAGGPRRHSELARTVHGATRKMLTQTLRKLERNGLVTRTVTPSVPPRVDYELTRLGRSLLPHQRALKSWAESNIETIYAARERYDAGQ